jgi:hypothetical protein
MSLDDERFVERLRTAYSPPPMTSFDVARFDARLHARLAQHQRRRPWMVGGGLLAVAAAVAVLLLWPVLTRTALTPPATAPTPDVDWLAAITDPAATDDWLDAPAADGIDATDAIDAIDATDATDATDALADQDRAPEWMPAEYEMLAQLIDIEPYAHQEDWP